MNFIQFSTIIITVGFIILFLKNNEVDDDDDGPSGGIMTPVFNS